MGVLNKHLLLYLDIHVKCEGNTETLTAINKDTSKEPSLVGRCAPQCDREDVSADRPQPQVHLQQTAVV